MPEDFREWTDGDLREADGVTSWPHEIGTEQTRRSTARRLWEASNVDLLHRQNVDVRLSATGRWKEEYARLLPLVESGGTAILAGPWGRGKTQLAACLIREACEEGHPSLFCDAADFFLDLRATYDKDADENERDVFERYASYHLLVIDEAHERSKSDFENHTLTRLINRRYANLKTTILITNEDPKVLQGSLGAAILSRVQETGFLIRCDWENYRLKDDGAKENRDQ